MDKTTNRSPIEKLFSDLGVSSPTFVKMDVLHNKITCGLAIQYFSNSFVKEAERVEPLRAKVIGLTKEEMLSYVSFLLYQRVLCVKDECKLWRKLKFLYIPGMIQACLTRVGKVIDRQFGITVLPEMDDPGITFEEAYLISEKVAAFEDVLDVHRDAMPRGPMGDFDTMTCTIFQDAIRSYHLLNDISASYFCAFMEMRLVEDMIYEMLFRVGYDDLTTATQMLMSRSFVK